MTTLAHLLTAGLFKVRVSGWLEGANFCITHLILPVALWSVVFKEYEGKWHSWLHGDVGGLGFGVEGTRVFGFRSIGCFEDVDDESLMDQSQRYWMD